MSAERPADGRAPQPLWWLQAAGKVWGPYPAERLAVFRRESRLVAATLVATQPTGPFGPAARRAELAGLFAATAFGEAAGADPAEAHHEAAAGPLLICAAPADADLKSFEAELARCGAVRALAPGVWLVRSDRSAAGLRNALSRCLSGEAWLLVAAAPLAGAAWFNLPGGGDGEVRRLWAGD